MEAQACACACGRRQRIEVLQGKLERSAKLEIRRRLDERKRPSRVVSGRNVIA